MLALAPTEEEKRALVAFLEKEVPLGRMGSSDEVANAALFPALDESSFVNGSELFTDGGAAQI